MKIAEATRLILRPIIDQHGRELQVTGVSGVDNNVIFLTDKDPLNERNVDWEKTDELHSKLESEGRL